MRGTLGRGAKGWRLEQDEKGYKLVYAAPDMGYGGQFESKVIVYGDKVEFDDIHSSNRHSYTTLTPNHSFVFGARATQNRHSVGLDLYSQERGYGWESNNGLNHEVDKGSRLLTAGRVHSTRPGTFKADVKDGVYLISLGFGNPGLATGPFDLVVDGVVRLTGLQADKGEYRTATTWAKVEGGQVHLQVLGGPWSLYGLGLSALGYATEDYEWDRHWWLDPETWGNWIERTVPLKDLPDVEFRKTEDSTSMAWAYGAHMDTFAGAIDHSRSSMDQSHEVESRIREFVEQGTRATIVNGDHFRLGLVGTRWDEINRQNLRLTVDKAHEHGLKVIEHFDINWVFPGYYKKFFEVLDQDPYSLQRHVGNPFIVQANFCLNSPAFFKMCVDYLQRQTLKTGVDGFMLDEMVFYGDQFCGCDHCRSQFYEDTGLHLPFADPVTLNEIHRNGKSPLWREWARWRGEKIYDMRARLMEEVRKVNPDSMLYGYNAAPISYARGTSATADQGMPSAVDFWGIEYHPDDAMANWRNLFARLKLDYAVASSWEKSPAWVLAKVTRTPSHFLQVWAIAQMTHNTLWFRAVDKEQTRMLTSWKYAMVNAKATSLADVAVVYSQRTVDVTDIATERGRGFYMEEFGGWCQSLAEYNVQYDVLNTTPDLENSLKAYRVVILPNVASMSDAEMEIYQSYMESGGTIVASFQTGSLDETGEPREQPFFEKWLGVAVDSQSTPIESLHWGELGKFAQTEINLPKTLEAVRIKETTDPELSFLAIAKQGPLVITRKIGNGRLVYISANLAQINYEPRIVSTSNVTVYAVRAQQGYTVDRVPALEERLVEMIRQLTDSNEIISPFSVPQGVIYTAWDNHDGHMVLHFLNCTGRMHLQKGETLPRVQTLETPVINEEIVIQVRTVDPVSGAVFYNVGSEKGIPCAVEEIEEGQYLVRIPAGSLIHYGNLILDTAYQVH